MEERVVETRSLSRPSMKGNGQIDVKSLAAGQGRARHGRATASARGRQVGRVEECGSQRASEPVELTNEAEDNVIITQPRHGHAFFSKMLAHSSGHSVLGFAIVGGGRAEGGRRPEEPPLSEDLTAAEAAAGYVLRKRKRRERSRRIIPMTLCHPPPPLPSFRPFRPLLLQLFRKSFLKSSHGRALKVTRAGKRGTRRMRRQRRIDRPRAVRVRSFVIGNEKRVWRRAARLLSRPQTEIVL